MLTPSSIEQYVSGHMLPCGSLLGCIYDAVRVYGMFSAGARFPSCASTSGATDPQTINDNEVSRSESRSETASTIAAHPDAAVEAGERSAKADGCALA